MTYTPNYKYIPPISLSILTPIYDFVCAITGLGEKFKKKVLESVKLKDGMIVADIGCGTGVFLKIAKERYPNVKFIGLDPDKKALAIAERRLKNGLDIELKEAFAESLPLHDHSVDVCFSTLAFHHMPDDIKCKAIREIHRVLKPDGITVIADFGEIKNPFLRKLFFWEHLEYIKGNFNGLIPRYLEEAGFRNVEIAGSHFPAIKLVKGAA